MNSVDVRLIKYIIKGTLGGVRTEIFKLRYFLFRSSLTDEVYILIIPYFWRKVNNHAHRHLLQIDTILAIL